MWVALSNDITHRLLGVMNESSWEKTALHFDLIRSLVPLNFSWRIGAALTAYCLCKRSVKREENIKVADQSEIHALVLIMGII